MPYAFCSALGTVGPPSLLEPSPCLEHFLIFFLFFPYFGAAIAPPGRTLGSCRARGCCRSSDPRVFAVGGVLIPRPFYLGAAPPDGCHGHRRQVQSGRQIRLPPARRTQGFAYGGRGNGWQSFWGCPGGRVAPGSRLGGVTCSGGSSTKLHVKGKLNGFFWQLHSRGSRITPRCPPRAPRSVSTISPRVLVIRDDAKTQRIGLQTCCFPHLQLESGGEKAPEHPSPGGIPTEQGMGKLSRGFWGQPNPARCRPPPGQGAGPRSAAGNINLFCRVKDPRAAPALCHWGRLLSQLGMF